MASSNEGAGGDSATRATRVDGNFDQLQDTVENGLMSHS
jgi:hypothetical protein